VLVPTVSEEGTSGRHLLLMVPVECTEQTDRDRAAGVAYILLDGSAGTHLGPFDVPPDVPPNLFCVACWLTDKTGADPAVVVINGLSVCYTHASYVQGGEMAAVLRLIQERKAAT
jgi:hypothetical protein